MEVTTITDAHCERQGTPVVTVRFLSGGREHEVRLTHFFEEGIEGFTGDSIWSELELADPDGHHAIFEVAVSVFRGEDVSFPIALKAPHGGT